MNDLGTRLRSLPLPEDRAAHDRVAAGLADAFERHRLRRRPARGRLATAAAAVAGLSLTAAALAATGPGDAVTRWLGDLVAPPPPAHRLAGLPADGRLLAISAEGAWLIDANGDRHTLGPFADATWSPHGLFVAGVRGAALTAVAPDGTVHWTLTAPGTVRDPRWAPDGYRIAYRSGAGLRVVAGDGSGDRPVARAVAAVAPAWRAGSRHVLAFLTASGVLRVAPTDRATSHRAAAGLRRARWIGWAGRRLLAATPRAVVQAGTGRRWVAPRGAAIATAAAGPAARDLAVLLRGMGRSRLVLLDARTLRPVRSLLTFAGAARGVTWSPDGRWILTALPAQGRWLLVPTAGTARPRAVTGLGAALGGTSRRARVAGWCCARG